MTVETSPRAPEVADLDHADGVELLRRQTDVLERLAAGAPLTEVLTGVAEALEELVPGCRCSILLLEPGGRTLRHCASPSLPPAYAAGIDGMSIGADAGSCGAAAYLGVPVVVADIGTDARWRHFRDLALPHGLRACWSSPIRGRTGVVGTFAVYHDEVHEPTPRERHLVERLTHLASVAIDHAGLYGALAESEERFRRAFEDNAVGMALTGLDRRLAKVNRALLEMLGRPEEELLGVSLTELLVPAGAADPLRDLVRGESDLAQYEARTRGADGRGLELAVTASAVRGADREPVHLSVNVLDVTERRAAERERRARREAEVARRTAEAASRAKSDFVAGLSHELRTPLQAIAGFTELLETVDLPVSRRREALRHIAGATGHILSLVDDVLDIARIEAGALPVHAEDVDVDRLAGEVRDLLEPLAREHQVDVEPARGGAVVRADRRRLRQVLINLVGNAIRYNRAGGWVRVETAPEGAGTVAVTVRDSGRGIPEPVMRRLFVPFDRPSRESGQGVGLGLVLAKGLSEAMGGTLSVESTVGTGTVATVRLPAALSVR